MKNRAGYASEPERESWFVEELFLTICRELRIDEAVRRLDDLLYWIGEIFWRCRFWRKMR